MDVILTGSGFISAILFIGKSVRRFLRWIRNAKMVELGKSKYGNKIYKNKKDGKLYEQNDDGELEEI